MSQFEFIKYEATPTEKQLGIATVKAYGKIILRLKIVKTKDGKGHFPGVCSYKIGTNNGEDVYLSAFLIDSRSEEEELMQLIRASVKQYISNSEEVPF